MKKYLFTALALLLVAGFATGCGCTNRNVSDHPNGRITDPTTTPSMTSPIPTMTTPMDETTRPMETTQPATSMPTMPTDSTSTGPITDSTDETGMTDFGRSRWPDRHS